MYNIYLGFVSQWIIIHSNKSNQPDASISQIYCSSFKYSSTCFGHPHAHHQELMNCSSRLWFYRWNVVVAVSLVVVGLDRPRPTTLLPPRSNGKPKAATAVHKLLMMGMRMPETCWAVFKRRAINQRDWCNWLVWFIWIQYITYYYCVQALLSYWGVCVNDQHTISY
jgi:hypothetical protein